MEPDGYSLITSKIFWTRMRENSSLTGAVSFPCFGLGNETSVFQLVAIGSLVFNREGERGLNSYPAWTTEECKLVA